MNKYDVIVIGAGNAGLISALELASAGKNVLLLEGESTPGGVATSFIRGRFEFEVSLHTLNDYGSKDSPGKLYELFDELGLNDKIEFSKIPEAYHVYYRKTQEDFIMPFGIENYIAKLEEYVPGSEDKIKNLFSLMEEITSASDYLEKNYLNIDMAYLVNKYPNYAKMATLTVDEAFSFLKIPSKAKIILSAYWFYLGSPTGTISFTEYSRMLFSYLKYGSQIPKRRSYDLSLLLATELEKRGGTIKYNSLVEEIIYQDNLLKGVILKDKTEYYASKIICDLSPNVVYGQMLKKSSIPKNAYKLTNSRVLGSRGFTINIGLNQSAKELGLNEYNYLIYNSLDSNEEYKNMNNIFNTTTNAYVLNNAIPSSSPIGTCIISFTTLFNNNTFDKEASVENYFDLKNQIAFEIIKNFEEVTKVDIFPYIEEIEISSPVTFQRYTHHPDGVIYGYKETGLDNVLPRILNYQNEQYVKNLYFCGNFFLKSHGYSNTYLSGKMVADEILKEEGDK